MFKKLNLFIIITILLNLNFGKTQCMGTTLELLLNIAKSKEVILPLSAALGEKFHKLLQDYQTTYQQQSIKLETYDRVKIKEREIKQFLIKDVKLDPEIITQKFFEDLRDKPFKQLLDAKTLPQSFEIQSNQDLKIKFNILEATSTTVEEKDLSANQSSATNKKDVIVSEIEAAQTFSSYQIKTTEAKYDYLWRFKKDDAIAGENFIDALKKTVKDKSESDQFGLKKPIPEIFLEFEWQKRQGNQKINDAIASALYIPMFVKMGVDFTFGNYNSVSKEIKKQDKEDLEFEQFLSKNPEKSIIYEHMVKQEFALICQAFPSINSLNLKNKTISKGDSLAATLMLSNIELHGREKRLFNRVIENLLPCYFDKQGFYKFDQADKSKTESLLTDLAKLLAKDREDLNKFSQIARENGQASVAQILWEESAAFKQKEESGRTTEILSRNFNSFIKNSFLLDNSASYIDYDYEEAILKNKSNKKVKEIYESCYLSFEKFTYADFNNAQGNIDSLKNECDLYYKEVKDLAKQKKLDCLDEFNIPKVYANDPLYQSLSLSEKQSLSQSYYKLIGFVRNLESRLEQKNKLIEELELTESNNEIDNALYNFLDAQESNQSKSAEFKKTLESLKAGFKLKNQLEKTAILQLIAKSLKLLKSNHENERQAGFYGLKVIQYAQNVKKFSDLEADSIFTQLEKMLANVNKSSKTYLTLASLTNKFSRLPLHLSKGSLLNKVLSSGFEELNLSDIKEATSISSIALSGINKPLPSKTYDEQRIHGLIYCVAYECNEILKKCSENQSSKGDAIVADSSMRIAFASYKLLSQGKSKEAEGLISQYFKNAKKNYDKCEALSNTAGETIKRYLEDLPSRCGQGIKGGYDYPKQVCSLEDIELKYPTPEKINKTQDNIIKSLLPTGKLPEPEACNTSKGAGIGEVEIKETEQVVADQPDPNQDQEDKIDSIEIDDRKVNKKPTQTSSDLSQAKAKDVKEVKEEEGISLEMLRRLILNGERKITAEEMEKLGFMGKRFVVLKKVDPKNGIIRIYSESDGGIEKAQELFELVKNKFIERELLKQERDFKDNSDRLINQYKDGSSIQLRENGKSGHPKVEIVDMLTKNIEKITFR